MTERTHLAAGVAAALMVMQPKTRDELTCAIVGGAIGGIFSDVDVKAASSRYAEMTAVALSAAMLGVDRLTGGSVVNGVLSNGVMAIAGGVMLALLVLLGLVSEHRGRTHSLVFLVMTALCVSLIDQGIAAAFSVGFTSHLAADALNMQPEKLFYPHKKGFCLKLCRSDGFMNELLFTLSVSLSAGYMLLVMA